MAGVYGGETGLAAIYAGEDAVAAVYAGETLIWPVSGGYIYEDGPPANETGDWVLVTNFTIGTSGSGIVFTQPGSGATSATLTRTSITGDYYRVNATIGVIVNGTTGNAAIYAVGYPADGDAYQGAAVSATNTPAINFKSLDDEIMVSYGASNGNATDNMAINAVSIYHYVATVIYTDGPPATDTAKWTSSSPNATLSAVGGAGGGVRLTNNSGVNVSRTMTATFTGLTAGQVYAINLATGGDNTPDPTLTFKNNGVSGYSAAITPNTIAPLFVFTATGTVASVELTYALMSVGSYLTVAELELAQIT
jgi:hypothetical protein